MAFWQTLVGKLGISTTPAYVTPQHAAFIAGSDVYKSALETAETYLEQLKSFASGLDIYQPLQEQESRFTSEQDRAIYESFKGQNITPLTISGMISNTTSLITQLKQVAELGSLHNQGAEIFVGQGTWHRDHRVALRDNYLKFEGNLQGDYSNLSDANLYITDEAGRFTPLEHSLGSQPLVSDDSFIRLENFHKNNLKQSLQEFGTAAGLSDDHISQLTQAIEGRNTALATRQSLPSQQASRA